MFIKVEPDRPRHVAGPMLPETSMAPPAPSTQRPIFLHSRCRDRFRHGATNSTPSGVDLVPGQVRVFGHYLSRGHPHAFDPDIDVFDLDARACDARLSAASSGRFRDVFRQAGNSSTRGSGEGRHTLNYTLSNVAGKRPAENPRSVCGGRDTNPRQVFSFRSFPSSLPRKSASGPRMATKLIAPSSNRRWNAGLFSRRFALNLAISL